MAKGKKNGSKSKKCTLPYEWLTPKQRRMLNSKVSIMKLNSFYSWDEFMMFSLETQTEYIAYICKKYKIGISTIERIIFNVRPYKLYYYLQKNGIPPISLSALHKRQKANKKDIDRLLSDMA